MPRIRYEVDPHNRLIIDKSGKKSELSRFRRVLDGRFRISRRNTLTYHIKTPLSGNIGIPRQVKLRGRWSLTENHDLRLTLDKWRRQSFGDQLTLQGDIIDVSKNSLLFALTTRTKEGVQSIYTLKLQGSWQADKNNRLTFRVKKGQDKHDILIFDGIWKIDKNYQLVYQYQKVQLKRRQKKIRTIIFKGYWNIKDRKRIAYVIDRNNNSVFNFRANLCVFKSRYIKYEIGIGSLSRLRPVRRVVVLFGSWRIKRGIGLVFDIECGSREVQSMVFSAQVRLTDKDTILFKLKDNLHRDMSIQLRLSHKILKGDGEAFLRLLKSKPGAAILVGAGWRW